MRYPLLLIHIINFRWCLKASSPPGAALGLYTQVLGEMKCTCQLSKIEIKTADIYFFHKQRYCAIHLFTYRDLAFSEFPVGTYLRSRPATSKGAMRNLRFQIVLPRLLEFDTWQIFFNEKKKKFRKIRIIFDIENWLWKSEIRIFQSPPAKRTLICQKIFYEKLLFSTQLSHHLMRKLLKNS